MVIFNKYTDKNLPKKAIQFNLDTKRKRRFNPPCGKNRLKNIYERGLVVFKVSHTGEQHRNAGFIGSLN